MIDHSFDTLSPERRDAVQAALSAAFGAAPVCGVKPLLGGATSAALFRFEARGRRYLVRVEGEPSPLRNPLQYISQRIASEAGIAPLLHHVDEEHRVIVTDFIDEKPLRDYPGGRGALLRALSALTQRLQATPVFPDFVTYPDIVARLFAHVRRAGLFADGLLDAHTERLARIAAEYPWDPAALVSAHNDPNPRNILFDGERLWLIDWESAYRNDPLIDVAILLDNLAPTPALEDVLLASWLGRAPDAASRERLAAMRALTRLYYAGVLLSASALRPREAPDGDLSAPSVADYARAVREGRIAAGAQSVHVMGKMYLAAFLSGGPVPPLATAVASGPQPEG
jgi:predicted Ser/Thr protein kinase